MNEPPGLDSEPRIPPGLDFKPRISVKKSTMQLVSDGLIYVVTVILVNIH